MSYPSDRAMLLGRRARAAALKEARVIETRRIKRDDGFIFLVNGEFFAAAESLIHRLKGLEGEEGASVVKKNMVRTVLRVEAEGMPLYIKRYHSSGLVEAVKSLLLPSRARSEWEAMARLSALGIPTAKPLFFGERRAAGVLKGAYFAAAEIEDAVDFGAFVQRAVATGAWERELKEALYGNLAELTRALHAAGVRHGDYHLGNILVQTHGAPRVYLIDLHTVSFPRTLSRGARILNLARVAEVLSKLDGGAYLDFFLEHYRKGASSIAPSLKDLRDEVMRIVHRLDLRRFKSRTRRCLKESTEFTRIRREGYVVRFRRTFDPEKILEAIQEHDTVKREGDERLLHPVFKNKVTRVMDSLCVKEYRPPSIGLRLIPFLSEARKAWIAGRALEVRGVDTPKTVAWVRGKGRAFLITRFTAGQRLYEYIRESCASLDASDAAKWQKALSRETAALVRRIHELGIRHSDLSEQNILVEEDGEERSYLLIDLDTVSFRKRIKEEERIKNLIQLGHMPKEVNVLAKGRFLAHYLGGKRGRAWRRMIRTVNEGVLARMERKRRKFDRLGLPDPHPIPSRLKGGW